MFKTTQDLLKFIEDAKAAGVSAFKVGDVEVQFSNIALADIALSGAQLATEERDTSKTLTDTLPQQADDEDLFWSART